MSGQRRGVFGLSEGGVGESAAIPAAAVERGSVTSPSIVAGAVEDAVKDGIIIVAGIVERGYADEIASSGIEAVAVEHPLQIACPYPVGGIHVPRLPCFKGEGCTIREICAAVGISLLWVEKSSGSGGESCVGEGRGIPDDALFTVIAVVVEGCAAPEDEAAIVAVVVEGWITVNSATVGAVIVEGRIAVDFAEGCLAVIVESAIAGNDFCTAAGVVEGAVAGDITIDDGAVVDYYTSRNVTSHRGSTIKCYVPVNCPPKEPPIGGRRIEHAVTVNSATINVTGVAELAVAGNGAVILCAIAAEGAIAGNVSVVEAGVVECTIAGDVAPAGVVAGVVEDCASRNVTVLVVVATVVERHGAVDVSRKVHAGVVEGAAAGDVTASRGAIAAGVVECAIADNGAANVAGIVEGAIACYGNQIRDGCETTAIKNTSSGQPAVGDAAGIIELDVGRVYVVGQI